MTIKEKLMTEKIFSLEQRLALVERFVELRFCETFRDFTIRNSRPGSGNAGTDGRDANAPSSNNSNNEDEDDFESQKDSQKNAEPRRSSRGRLLKASARGNIAVRGSGKPGRGTTLRKCVVRVERTSDTALAKLRKAGEKDHAMHYRYGTRGQTRAIEGSPVVVKQEVEENVDDRKVSFSLHGGDDGVNKSVRGTGESTNMSEDNDDGGSDYFTYPTDENSVVSENDQDVGGEDDDLMEMYSPAENDEPGSHRKKRTRVIHIGLHKKPKACPASVKRRKEEENKNVRKVVDKEDDDLIDMYSNVEKDEEWSGAEDEDEDEYVPTKKKRANRPFQPSSSSTSNRGRRRGRPKKQDTGDAKKRQHVYYLASISDLSKDSKIVSTDSTREECPICKQYWKRECIQSHIASHTRERHLKCDHCDKRYFSVDDLRIHTKITHDREKHFPRCRLCQEPIVRKMILHEKFCVKRAIQNGDEVEESLIDDIRQQCAKAGLEFSLPDESVPPGCDPAEKIECPTCKRYCQRRYFDRHVKMHSLERNWKCGKCPKAYIHKHDLIRHMCITHEISLKCDLCDKTFETRMLLHGHKLKCRKSKGLAPMPRTNMAHRANRARKANQLIYNPDESLMGDEEEDEQEEEEERKSIQRQEEQCESSNETLSEAIPMAVDGEIIVEGTDFLIETTEEVVAAITAEEIEGK